MQRNLLLVDDEIGILRALRRLFRKAGYEIYIAESAEEALAVLAQNEIHVILSDFRMPGADGGVLLQQASKIDPACVGMILSGFAELKQVIGAFNSGVVHRFISKPWVDQELLEQVENAFAVAQQKRIELDLDRLNLLAQAAAEHKRYFPIDLIETLDTDESCSLIAVEFVSPRVLLAGSGLNVKEALAQRITTLLELLPNATEFCHWNGYTLVLRMPHSELHAASALVESFSQRILAETQRKGLRWSQLEHPHGTGADQMRELLLMLAQIDSEADAFGDSGWADLLDSQLTDSLTQALHQSEFGLVFQPICSDQNQLVALEALIRFESLEHSNISLTSLIRHIDRLGYTEQFSEIQISLAFSQFAALQLPQSVKLVLNLSLRQLSSPLLKQLLLRELQTHAIELHRLSIDVGESALKSAAPACVQNLEWFRGAGVELTLDDQGSAHAYLNSEESLPVDAVKLDRAFLHDLDSQANRQEMLVNLCDRILERGKRLSFEGVENGEQLNFVRTRYSFSYQGYALAKPMSGAEILSWYNSGDAQ